MGDVGLRNSRTVSTNDSGFDSTSALDRQAGNSKSDAVANAAAIKSRESSTNSDDSDSTLILSSDDKDGSSDEALEEIRTGGAAQNGSGSN